MSGCLDTGRPGCCGMLCRSAHASLQRLPVMRYPTDDFGRPDTAARPDPGWVCALLSYQSEMKEGRLSVPGVAGGLLSMHLTVAAGSFDVPIAAGDRLTVDGRRWRVSVAATGRFITAVLIPEDSEPWD